MYAFALQSDSCLSSLQRGSEVTLELTGRGKIFSDQRDRQDFHRKSPNPQILGKDLNLEFEARIQPLSRSLKKQENKVGIFLPPSGRFRVGLNRPLRLLAS
jgi:hypothetical protein